MHTKVTRLTTFITRRKEKERKGFKEYIIMARTAEDYLKDKEWVERIDGNFDRWDRNKNGFVTREEVVETLMGAVERAASDHPDAAPALAEARKRTEEWMDALGMAKGLKVGKDKHREMSAAFAVIEGAKHAKGELTYTEKSTSACFDVLDVNRNGYLSFEEYKVLLKKGHNIDEDVARTHFDAVDKNKTGRLNKHEYLATATKFWV